MLKGALPEIGLTVRQSVPLFLIVKTLVGGVTAQPPIATSGKICEEGVIVHLPRGRGHDCVLLTLPVE